MKATWFNWRMAGGIAAAALMFNASTVLAAGEAEVAEHLIDLVKIGRGVMSEQMGNINDASKSNKGFTGDYMAAQVIERFKKKTKIDLRIPNAVPQAGLYLALVEAEKDVVDEAQPVINRAGIGFKGFIPAVFARKTGENFYKKTGVKLKLTGIDYRNASNRPDDFEAEVLRMFSDPRHPKGQTYVRNTMLDGRPVLRMMDPEYAAASCLACHGARRAAPEVVVESGRHSITRTRREPMSKILVVDDSYAELQVIEGVLKGANHTVVSFPNTEKLEDKVVGEKPDLIVMDVVMPGRNGFQACRDLKNDDRTKNIPIILCTSKGNESDKFWGQQQGANAHVVKPFKGDELLAAVKRVLG
jgi:CheY-like chemotaxis protein